MPTDEKTQTLLQIRMVIQTLFIMHVQPTHIKKVTMQRVTIYMTIILIQMMNQTLIRALIFLRNEPTQIRKQ